MVLCVTCVGCFIDLKILGGFRDKNRESIVCIGSIGNNSGLDILLRFLLESSTDWVFERSTTHAWLGNLLWTLQSLALSLEFFKIFGFSLRSYFVKWSYQMTCICCRTCVSMHIPSSCHALMYGIYSVPYMLLAVELYVSQMQFTWIHPAYICLIIQLSRSAVLEGATSALLGTRTSGSYMILRLSR